MALRKPLVIVNGQVGQLQAGDTLDAVVSEVDVISRTNANASQLPIGTPVYTSVAGSVNAAQANAAGTVEVLGFLKNNVAAAASGIVQTDGILAATTAEWDAITGATGGLTIGAYWLDPDNAGRMVNTAPADAGDYVVRLGKAISTTEFEISIESPIKL